MRSGKWWRAKTLVRAAASVLFLVGIAGCKGEPPANAAPSDTMSVSLSALDPDLVAQGQQVYRQNCASCHGPKAEGTPNWTQPDARGNLPPPPHDDSGHTWRHSDAMLAEAIHNGQRDVFNKTPELTMPPFQDRLTDKEITAVMIYFKSLWSPEHRRFQGEQNQKPAMPMSGSGR